MCNRTLGQLVHPVQSMLLQILQVTISFVGTELPTMSNIKKNS